MVNQFKEEIHAGDRVYLWLSGQRAGVVAVAEALTDPAMMGPGSDDVEFARQPEKLGGDSLRVHLEIDEVLAPPVPKHAFLADAVLRDATIIRAPFVTNFRLSPEQDAAIRGLISRRDPWEAAVRLCGEIMSDRESFDSDERDYKLEISQRVLAAVDIARSDDGEFPAAVRGVLAPPNNLVDWRTAAALRSWAESRPTAAVGAVLELAGAGSLSDRIDRFDAALPRDVVKAPGARLAVASLFLMGMEPEELPVFRPTPFSTVEQRLGWPEIAGESLGAEYEEHLAFAREFRRRLEAEGVPIRDMVDVQGLIWVLAKSDSPEAVAWRTGVDVADFEAPAGHQGGGLAPVPAANISYANEVLVEIGASEPESVDDLLASGDPERLFKSERQHVAPRERARDLVRFARGLGLLERGRPLRLTALGRAYVDARDAEDPFRVTAGQAAVLRETIELGAPRGAICSGAVLALSLWRSADASEQYSIEEFGRALARAGGASTWTEPRTFVSQGRGYTALLIESGLLDTGHNVTADGETLLERLGPLAHAQIADILGQPVSPEAASTTQPAQVWWVNQGETYAWSRDHELLWAPKVNKAGRAETHWTRLLEARVGDRVLHYSGGSLRAVGTVIAAAEEGRPSGIPSQDASNNDGWKLAVRYEELREPVALRDIPSSWRTPSAGPFATAGGVLQGYFFPLSQEFAARLAGEFPQLGLPAAGDELAPGVDYVEPEFALIVSRILESGLRLDEQTIRRYHVSLRTRGFVVLSALSGSGKTALATRYAGIVGAQSLVVSVAPNWTTNEDLLGYVDPINGDYRHTQFSEFLIAAQDERERAQLERRTAQPFHLILDEMNLARVEYYFAKFLSAMELRTAGSPALIDLGGGFQVLLRSNLKFVGTVNVDETTHAFADKVYDRAQLIEVPVDRAGLELHTAGRSYQSVVLAIWDTMSGVAPFAYRVLDDMASYVEESARLGIGWQTAIDEQLLQKVLPKVKGTDPRIGDALQGFIVLTHDRFPLSNAKATAMSGAYRDHGFVSYF